MSRILDFLRTPPALVSKILSGSVSGIISGCVVFKITKAVTDRDKRIKENNILQLEKLNTVEKQIDTVEKQINDLNKRILRLEELNPLDKQINNLDKRILRLEDVYIKKR